MSNFFILRGEMTELKPLTYIEKLEIFGIGPLVRGGFPNPADDFFRDAINISEVIVENVNSTYYAYAWSDSMEPLICEGAMLIVDISADVKNGNYGVFELDGDLCMKRYWKENGVITLHSENKKYAPIVVQEYQHFRVVGKITKFIQTL